MHRTAEADGVDAWMLMLSIEVVVYTLHGVLDVLVLILISV